MTYLGRPVIGNFKQPKDPNKKREPKARDKRPGMSPEHIALIRKLPSCISGKRPCDPHHLKIKNERGVSLKATDRWALPVIRSEHETVQPMNAQRELAWFMKHGVNPYDLANALWKQTGDLERMEKIIRAYLGDTRWDR